MAFLTSAAVADDERTMAAIYLDREQFIQDRLIDSYREFGERDAASDAAAEEFFRAIAPWIVSSPLKAPYGDVWKLARRVHDELGSKDPLVEYCYGFMLNAANHDGRGLHAVSHSLHRLDKESAYPRDLVALAAVTATDFYEYHNMRSSVEPTAHLAVDAYIEALATGLYDDRFERFVELTLPLLRKEIPRSASEKLVNAIVADEERAPRVFAHLYQGTHERRLAWDARGGGYAHTVTERGWQLFHQHVAKSREHFVQAAQESPGIPHVHQTMITTITAGAAEAGESARSWFERGREVQFDWMPLYGAYLNELRPRWNGSIEELYAFGLECAATERWDTPVPYFLFNVLATISDDMQDWDPIGYWAEEGVAELCYTILEKMAAHPNHARRLDKLKTWEAAVAWANQDWDRAHRVVTELGDRLDVHIIHGSKMGVRPRRLADDAALYSSEHVELVEQADMHYWEDELDEAVTLYSQLREKVEGDDLAAAVDRRLAVAKIEQALQRDEWFDIVFDEQLSGFLRLSGAWRRVDDRTISGKVALSIGPDEEMLLVSEAYTRNQWEMKATIDMSRMEGAEWLGAAILAHYSDIAPDWRSIHFQPTLKSVSAVRRFFKEAKSPAELDLARPFDVHVKVWEDQVVVAVNGDRVYAGPFLGFEPKSVGNQFGFGARASAIRRGELYISNIAIRGLFEAPAELVQPGY